MQHPARKDFVFLDINLNFQIKDLDSFMNVFILESSIKTPRCF